MALYDSLNGVYRKVKKKYDAVAGVHRTVKKAYDDVDGVYRQYYSGVEMVTLYIHCQNASLAPDAQEVESGLGTFDVNGEHHWAYYEGLTEFSVPKGSEIKIYQGYATSMYDADHSALVERFCVIEHRRGGSTVDYWTGEYRSATFIADTDMEIKFMFDVIFGEDERDWFVAGVTHVIF